MILFPQCLIKTLDCSLAGKKAMMTNGGTILVMMPVLMMTTVDVEKCTAMILTDAAFTVSSRRTACTVPIVTTAGKAASALVRSR